MTSRRSPFGDRGATRGLASAWFALGLVIATSAVGAGPPGHWAFRAPRLPDVPSPKDAGRVRNPIDAFVFDRLQRESLKPAAEAGRLALLRRASFDVTGLPPTPEEVERFSADDRPDAYDRLVDRLLARPEYGERWGRHDEPTPTAGSRRGRGPNTASAGVGTGSTSPATPTRAGSRPTCSTRTPGAIATT